MKTKMTRAQALKYVENKYVVVWNRSEVALVRWKFGDIGLRLEDFCEYEFPFRMGHSFGKVCTNWQLDIENITEIHLYDLLDIQVVEVVEEPAMWTNEDIDAAYLLGLINSDSINTVDRTAKEIERLKGLGFTRPYEALMAVRYPGQETRADYRHKFEECFKMLEELTYHVTTFNGVDPERFDKAREKAKQFIQENKGV